MRRRDRDTVQENKTRWRAWCRENAGLISASGVPVSVLTDAGHWRDFLEIGDRYPVDFDHNRLSLSQKVALLRLISARSMDRSTPVAGCMIEAVLGALEPRL
jgi:hypothetical protein